MIGVGELAVWHPEMAFLELWPVNPKHFHISSKLGASSERLSRRGKLQKSQNFKIGPSAKRYDVGDQMLQCTQCVHPNPNPNPNPNLSRQAAEEHSAWRDTAPPRSYAAARRTRRGSAMRLSRQRLPPRIAPQTRLASSETHTRPSPTHCVRPNA